MVSRNTATMRVNRLVSGPASEVFEAWTATRGRLS